MGNGKAITGQLVLGVLILSILTAGPHPARADAKADTGADNGADTKANTARSTPHARIVDARTIRLNGETYRLRFIRVPAPGATCKRNGRDRDCSKIARAQLIDITIGAQIDCRRTPSGDQCRAGGYDLSHGMVHTGWARSSHPDLAKVQSDAQSRRRGLWHADWQGPDEWLN